MAPALDALQPSSAALTLVRAQKGKGRPQEGGAHGKPHGWEGGVSTEER